MRAKIEVAKMNNSGNRFFCFVSKRIGYEGWTKVAFNPFKHFPEKVKNIGKIVGGTIEDVNEKST